MTSGLDHAAPGRVFHISRVWGSRHGGSIYSQAMTEAMLRKGWKVTLLAQEFQDEPGHHESHLAQRDKISPPDDRTDALADETRWAARVDRVKLTAFFSRAISKWPRRIIELFKVWRLITGTKGARVIVQGDLPRLVYLCLQLRAPLVFVRQDGILTCPGNNRFMHRSRSVCPREAGFGCLWVNRREACLGLLPFPRQIGRLLFRLRDRLLLRWIRNFVANSKYVAAVHRKPHLVLCPPRRSGSEPHVARERRLERLAFCGRLEMTKGPAEAIRILSLLPDCFNLEILGDGPERARLGRLVEALHLEARVRFHGWVDASTRDHLLAGAGVLMMPTLTDEAFGMAGIEALAQGTPVVAYDVGGIAEWCSHKCGQLVPCGDIHAAAAAVRRLTDVPARWAAYSAAAKETAERQFPPSRFESELADILRVVWRRDTIRRPTFEPRMDTDKHG